MKKYAIYLYSLALIFSCTGRGVESDSVTHTSGAKHAAFTPPQVTILANLPDSLQPRTVASGSEQMTRVVAVPTHKGGSYSFVDNRGLQKRNFEVAVKKMLPVLQNAKGEPEKDSAGNVFVMGDGGTSNFTTFTTDNGLALESVTCSIRDKQGNLWFGTGGGGVSCYDGRSFTNFSAAQGLAANQVLCICEDHAGNLWFGTDGGGVSRFDGKVFTNFSTAQGLANGQVYSICEDKKGNLWFGTRTGGVSRYNPSMPVTAGSKLFTSFDTSQGLASNQVLTICEDRSGTLWFGTYGGGISSYDGKSFKTFSSANGLSSNLVLIIREDNRGNIWIGTDGGGVSRYDPSASPKAGSKPLTVFSVAQGLASNSVRSICEDKAGNIWFGTDGGGVSRYSPSASLRAGTKSLTSFTTAQGLASNLVSNICEDKSGNLWFGTDGAGVSRYDGNSFTTFSMVHGLANNQVWSICEDKASNLLFCTLGGGVSRYDGNSFMTFSDAQGLANNQVLSVCEDRTGNLWFGTYGGGACKFDGATFTSFLVNKVAGRQVWSTCSDKAGNIWFGTLGGGATRFSSTGKKGLNGSFMTFTTAQGLADSIVRSIFEDRAGNLWFATDGGGVSRYDGVSFMNFSSAQGLADKQVWNILEDKEGNLWFATSKGLNLMSAQIARTLDVKRDGIADKNNPLPIFRTFTKTDGLPDNMVTQVLQMPDGKMAIGTNLGIALFRPSADFSMLNEMAIYNSNTGCPVKDINAGQHCMYLDSKGIIWAGTGSEKTALVRFDPSALHSNMDAPRLKISSIKVNEEHICWYDLAQGPEAKPDSNVTPAYITEEVTTTGRVLTEGERDSMKRRFGDVRFDSISRFYAIPQNLVLPYRNNQVTIDFNAIETGKPNLVNYQYILEGYDKEWGPVTKSTSANFGNIHEGQYTFKVKAQGPNGVWCEPITYTFTVLPPWYRAWWAYGLYVAFFLFALKLFSQWRERKLRIEKETLAQKVEERTAVVEQQKEELLQKNIVVEREKQRSEELLLNILPGEVAEELKAKGSTTARHFDNVTVLFSDFVNFTQAGERMSPQELVDELHACFKAFDEITGKYNIEKIKTVGDAYLAVCGLPTPNSQHAENMIRAAMEINDFMQDRAAKLGNRTFGVRIGIHSGSVVAGIVGIKKFAYDIWGDTVNTAARMEQSSEAGKINISQTTYDLVKDKINCTYRGEIDAKGKGRLKMYFVS